MASMALRAPASWRLSDLLAAPLGKDAREAVVVVYEANDDPQRRAYDVITFPAAGRR